MVQRVFIECWLFWVKCWVKCLAFQHTCELGGTLPNSFTFQGEMTVVMWSLWFRPFRKVQLSHHSFLFPTFSLVSEQSGYPVIRSTILKRALNLTKIQVQVSALLPTSFCWLFNPPVPQRSYLKIEVIISTLQNCNKDEIRLCERASKM